MGFSSSENYPLVVESYWVSMAVDFQVVFPQELIQLTQVRIASGLSLKTLDIIGADFSSVDEVLINGIPSPDVIIMSNKRLLAQVPDQVLGDQLTSINVTSRKLTITKQSKIQFKVAKTPTKVSGILRLVQLFLKILFTTPGTDIFSPRTGGGGLRSIGKTFGADEGSSIISDFIVAVDQTRRQIISIQGRDPRIPRDERLMSAKVLKAVYNKAESALIVSVELISQAGNAATANVEL